MCENCFQELIYKFPTYQAFDEFDNFLQLKCTEGKLTILDKHEIDYLSAFDSNLYFECKVCKEEWVLSIPDYAWRGYFLPIDKALEYKASLKAIDKRKGMGCLIVLAIILIVLLWRYF